MWVLNMGKPVNIPVLSEAMAIELGANLLGEGIIFIIAASILIAEYSRQVRKETAKENARLAEIAEIQNNIQQLYSLIQTQNLNIEELSTNIQKLESTSSLARVFKLKNSSSGSKPSPPTSGSISPVSSSSSLKNVHGQPQPPQGSLVHEALQYIETDLLADNEKNRIGLINKGLDYLYYNSFLIS